MGFMRPDPQPTKTEETDDVWRTEDVCETVARLVREAPGLPYIDKDHRGRVHPLYRVGNEGRYRVNFVRDDGRIRPSFWAVVELGPSPRLVKLGAMPRMTCRF